MLACHEVCLVTLFLPLLLECSAETVLTFKKFIEELFPNLRSPERKLPNKLRKKTLGYLTSNLTENPQIDR